MATQSDNATGCIEKYSLNILTSGISNKQEENSMKGLKKIQGKLPSAAILIYGICQGIGWKERIQFDRIY